MHASNIFTTFIDFLSLELEPIIYWPTSEETLSYTHPHFHEILTNLGA